MMSSSSQGAALAAWLKTLASSIVVVGGLAAAALVLQTRDASSRWPEFLGGFHPLFLHLPIGVVALIAVQRIWHALHPSTRRPADRLMWFVAAVTATVSFLTGLLLAGGGGYQSEYLDRHLWSAGVFTSLCWIALMAQAWNLGHRVQRVLLGGSLASMAVAGHYGSLMVHGDPFAAAPWLHDPQRFARFEPFGTEVAVYDELIRPILGAKCIVCHGRSKQNGRLRLDSIDGIRRGGEHGGVVVPGDVARSSLVGAIQLPAAHDNHMPPSNRPQISPEELAGLMFWIEAGADELQIIDGTAPPAELAALMDPAYRLLEDPAEVEARLARVARLEQRFRENRSRLTHEIESLPEPLRHGFSFADQRTDRLHFNPATYGHLLSEEDLTRVTELLTACVEVDLSRLPLSGELLVQLGKSAVLEKLNLSETAVGDDVFATLSPAPQLRVLNLFGARLTVAAEVRPGGFSQLERLYLGDTAASVAAIQAALPHVQVWGNLTLPAPPALPAETDETALAP